MRERRVAVERKQSRATPSAPPTRRSVSPVRHDSGIALSINTLIFEHTSLVWLRCCTLVLRLPTMVVLVDLDDDEPTSLENPHPSSGRFNVKPLYHSLDAPTEGSVTAGYERPNPNINGFSQALSCYPFVSSSHSMDLTPRLDVC